MRQPLRNSVKCGPQTRLSRKSLPGLLNSPDRISRSMGVAEPAYVQCYAATSVEEGLRGMEGSVAWNLDLLRFRFSAMMLGVVLLPNLAIGQLRTGRGTRSLYQESVEQLTESGSTGTTLRLPAFRTSQKTQSGSQSRCPRPRTRLCCIQVTKTQSATRVDLAVMAALT